MYRVMCRGLGARFQNGCTMVVLGKGAGAMVPAVGC